MEFLVIFISENQLNLIQPTFIKKLTRVMQRPSHSVEV